MWCLLNEKQTRVSFKLKKVVSTSKPIEFLHIDLFGSLRTRSLGGKYYGFVIVDNYSRFTWTLFLTHKEEIFKTSLNWLRVCKKNLIWKFSHSIVIMVVNYWTINLKTFVKKTELLIPSHVREFHKKMVLLSVKMCFRRIGLDNDKRNEFT